jgi:hypothetical protein
MPLLSPTATKNLKQQIAKEPVFRKEVKQIIEKDFFTVHDIFLKAFDSHPVTMEIEGGPSANNSSRTLGGVGNLYTYIGFQAGSHPIKSLRKTLEKYSIRYNNLRGGLRAIIEVPTKEDVFAVTPMPWAMGRSWARGIERGISGLGQYLVKSGSIPQSRSGRAIEVKGKIRSGKFSNVSYMSALLNDYYKSIKKLENKTF